MCLYPKLIHNPKYLPNKKNGGHIPPIKDNRTILVPIGCQKCIECRKQKAREWQVRLTEEVKENKNGVFITLTFSDKAIAEIANKIKGLSGYELDNEIATYAVRHFLENWRKKYKKSLRHWFVTELGHNGTKNIHLHGIVFPENQEQILELKKKWLYGFIWLGNTDSAGRIKNIVNQKTVNYIVKYVSKQDFENTEYKSKILTSAGIGRNYTNTPHAGLNKFNEEKTRNYYITDSGHIQNLPIYYKNKIYSEEEKEKLWLYLLDKEERFVLGQKISIAETDQYYMDALQEARIKNKRLGYGDDSKNWERKRYENEKRKLMQKTRIAKGKKPNAR